MSYDLHLFRNVAGGDPVAAATASLELDSDDLNPGPIDTAAEVRKKALVSALQAANPKLAPFRFDYAQIAQLQGLDNAEARRRWRHIELNGPEDGNGIQLTLNDDTASITVPYWHQADAAREVWREIWRYLEVLRRDGDFLTYDPQLERVLDLAEDHEAVIASYARGVEFTTRIAAEHVTPPKPWWKVW